MKIVASKSLTCYCEACRQTVSLSEKFCSSCGAILGDIQCPKCGYLGPPLNFKEGCPKCLYLNAKSNKSSGILHLNTLKTVHSFPSSDKIKGKIFSQEKEKRTSSFQEPEIVSSVKFSLFTSVFIVILLSFSLIGGFLWLNR